MQDGKFWSHKLLLTTHLYNYVTFIFTILHPSRAAVDENKDSKRRCKNLHGFLSGFVLKITPNEASFSMGMRNLVKLSLILSLHGTSRTFQSAVFRCSAGIVFDGRRVPTTDVTISHRHIADQCGSTTKSIAILPRWSFNNYSTGFDWFGASLGANFCGKLRCRLTYASYKDGLKRPHSNFLIFHVYVFHFAPSLLILAPLMLKILVLFSWLFICFIVSAFILGGRFFID